MWNMQCKWESVGVVLKQKFSFCEKLETLYNKWPTESALQTNTVSFDFKTGMTSFHLPLKAFCWLWTSSDSRLLRLDIAREHQAEATARSSDVRQL